MEIQDDRKFVKRVERLVNPMAVSNLLFLQSFKKLLPSSLVKKLLYKASKKTPNIGFVIDPYSLFLFFKIRDIDAAESMLQDRYELAKTRIFADDEPDYYMGIGNLSTRASTFWGVRQESYLIAKDRETGLLSWIFIDILSNTLIALPTKGIIDPNSSRAVFTTSSRGEVLLEFAEDRTSRELVLHGSIKNGTLRRLFEPIWLMGNTSISHSKRLSGGDDNPFAVIFDPAEVDEALDIPTEDIDIKTNTLFPGLAEPGPSKVVCFPYAQHYIADSPGCYTTIADRDELISNYNKMADADKIKTFSAETIVRQVSIGIVASTLLILLLVILF